VLRFVHAGLQGRQKVVYIAEDDRRDDVVGLFEQAGRYVSEAFADGQLRETGTVALCQYDHRRFDRATAREAERVHQLVLAERDADGGAPCELLVERGPNGDAVLRGEVDSHSCGSLAKSLSATIARSDAVRLDLGDLSFIGAAGLQVIRDAAREIDARGGCLTLISPRPAVRQVIGLMGLDSQVVVEQRP
jgi:anti-anti-sigma factor